MSVVDCCVPRCQVSEPTVDFATILAQLGHIRDQLAAEHMHEINALKNENEQLRAILQQMWHSDVVNCDLLESFVSLRSTSAGGSEVPAGFIDKVKVIHQDDIVLYEYGEKASTHEDQPLASSSEPVRTSPKHLIFGPACSALPYTQVSSSDWPSHGEHVSFMSNTRSCGSMASDEGVKPSYMFDSCAATCVGGSALNSREKTWMDFALKVMGQGDDVNTTKRLRLHPEIQAKSKSVDHIILPSYVLAEYLDTNPVIGSRQSRVSNRNSFHSTSTVVFKMRSTVYKEAISSLDRFFACKCIISPESRGRLFWMLLALCLVAFDMVTVPLSVSFEINPESAYGVFATYVPLLYWTLDILVSFLTGIELHGHQEMRMLVVGKIYVKTWFPFDFTLVCMDWVFFVSDVHLLSSNDRFAGLLFRGLPRMLRLLRIMQLRKFHTLLVNAMDASWQSIELFFMMVKTSGFFLFVVHLIACTWHGICRTTGGAGPEVDHSKKTHVEQYIDSAFWTAQAMHGTFQAQNNQHQTLFSFIVGIFSYLYLGLYVGVSVYGVFRFRELYRDRRDEMLEVCAAYVKKYSISHRTAQRARKVISDRHEAQKTCRALQQHMDFLEHLPKAIRVEFCEEARCPSLMFIPFFHFAKQLDHRAVRTLCEEALTDVLFMSHEMVFSNGDVACRMLFVLAGSLVYKVPWNSLIKVKKRRHKPVSLCKGMHITQIALWTPWSHLGYLRSAGNGHMLALSVEKFLEFVPSVDSVCCLAVRYAKQILKALNRDRIFADDLFECTIQEEALQYTEETEDDNHFMFLSHFKAEAGTEATLMQEALTGLIQDDFDNPASDYASPVFLDSADLQDLTTLTDHVKRSHNIVVLLTPKIFQRPWCLVEIVTALQSDIPIVPVEIQRPAMYFIYPDEDFYESLRKGETLEPPSLQLLKDLGIELDDVEKAIRHVFNQIAVPFSPHKSASIRNAELNDILGRCSQRNLADRVSTAS